MITKAQHRIVLGRGLLVQNLLGHLLKGTWSVVAGGPKIGKTTLLQQVAGNLPDGIRPVRVEPMKITTLNFKTTRMRPARPVILLIDGCEALLPDPGGVVRQAHQRIRQIACRNILQRRLVVESRYQPGFALRCQRITL